MAEFLEKSVKVQKGNSKYIYIGLINNGRIFRKKCKSSKRK